jgi:hypothetical protein
VTNILLQHYVAISIAKGISVSFCADRMVARRGLISGLCGRPRNVGASSAIASQLERAKTSGPNASRLKSRRLRLLLAWGGQIPSGDAVGMLLRVASGEFGEQILIAILPQELEQVGKSLAKQRDMCTHDLAGLRRVAAKDCHHNLFVFGDR